MIKLETTGSDKAAFPGWAQGAQSGPCEGETEGGMIAEEEL